VDAERREVVAGVAFVVEKGSLDALADFHGFIIEQFEK
jgi:hypothetical protein